MCAAKLGHVTVSSSATLNITNYVVKITANSFVTVSCSSSIPLLLLNGADNVTIDGTVNKYITFRNTSTGGAASALNLRNGADNNLIQYCTFEGSTIGVFNNGVINISSNLTKSCVNDVFSNNTITNSSTGLPQYGVTIEGLSNANPTNNIQFLSNNICNFFSPTGFSIGIYSYRYNNTLLINGNSFYQTATRFATNNNHTNRMIEIDDGYYANSGSVTVTNNFFGGSDQLQGGLPYTITNTTGASVCFPIVSAGSNLHNTIITGNKIGNITLNNNFNLTTDWNSFMGINITNGKAKIENNEIGNTANNGSITINNSLSGANTNVNLGIYNISARKVLINNNTIRSITQNTTLVSGTPRSKIWGIYNYGNDSCTISNNTIGSSTISQSIKTNLNNAFCQMWGIGTEDSNVTITGNTVQNLSNESLDGDFTGIGLWTFNGNKTVTCTGNNVLDFAANQTAKSYMNGISVYVASPTVATLSTVNINNNVVKNFSSTSSTSDISMNGIAVINNNGAVASSVSGNINNNTIENFNNSNYSSTAIVSGIYDSQGHNAGLNVNNNTIKNIISNVANMSGISIQTLTAMQATAGLTTIKNNLIFSINCNYNANNVSHSAIDVDVKNGLIQKNTIYAINAPIATTNSSISGIQLYFSGTQTMKTENNMISLGESVTNNIPIYGINISADATPVAGQAHIDYNSVVILGAGAGTESAAFKKGNSTLMNSFKNNILYNTRDGLNNYSAIVSNTTGWLGANANKNYFVSNDPSTLCLYAANPYNLASWQTNTSGDPNSVTRFSLSRYPTTVANDLFLQPNVANLFINTSNTTEAGVIQNIAASISSIPDDILSALRDNATPDIGAHEFPTVVVLPLNLISFEGKKVHESDILTWKTSNQFNFSYFEIEYANNTGIFNKISRVEAKQDLINNYSFESKNTTSGNHYYRLKMINKDKSFEYSKIISIVNLRNNTEAIVFPNPIKDVLNLYYESETNETLNIKIIDNQGRIVKSVEKMLEIGQNSIQISMQDLPKGIYMLSLKNENTAQNKKIILE